MISFGISRVFDQHTRLVAIAVGLLLATIAPAVVPAFAAADQVTDRSAELSSSAKAATGVSYKFNFTAANTAGAVVVQFCSNSPLIGQECTAPGGFTAAAATASGGATLSGTPTANKVVVTKSITTGVNDFTLANITNPSATGALYARVVTYADATAAGNYSVDGETIGTNVDEGGIAMSITENVNVSAAVLESMTFCVAGGSTAITANCNGGGALTAPTLKLGKDIGGVIALESDLVYTGAVQTQISTNAAKGAVVSLKSNAASCGGLIRSSDLTACDIKPAGTTGTIAAGEAKFGLKLGANITDATNGDLEAVSGYNNTDYRFNYVAGNATGVTSTYGDPILTTKDKPANNRNMELTFGASVSNNTPAGSYSTDISLVATGKF